MLLFFDVYVEQWKEGSKHPLSPQLSENFQRLTSLNMDITS